MLHSNMYSGGVLVYGTSGVMFVLVNLCLRCRLMANPGSREWHGDSCACQGMASRGVMIGVRASSSSVRRSRVCPCLFESLPTGESSGNTGVDVATSHQHRAP
jgi:hypothetical protein